MSVTYIRKSRGLRIDPCGTPLETSAGSENLFPKLTKKVIWDEIKTFHGQLYQMSFVNQSESCQSSNLCQNPLEFCQFKTERQKSVE